MKLNYHIQINGLVQGLGFRPFVYRLAKSLEIYGRVNNTSDGLSIFAYGTKSQLDTFYYQLIHQAPKHAILKSHSSHIIDGDTYSDFQIENSTELATSSLLITPDISICNTCKQEYFDKHSNRFHYSFINCTDCGPRYSILKGLPYDRVNTSMHYLKMCNSCKDEYQDENNRRFYSQTDSCPKCAIPMHIYNSEKEELSSIPSDIFHIIQQALHAGKIIAVKSTGGYLLLCDATNATTIDLLRERKHRPHKPFAILYHNIQELKKDVNTSAIEEQYLLSDVAPIVLCSISKTINSKLQKQKIAPGLSKIGAMLPSNAILLRISNDFHKPLVATSANISGSPIIYKDDEALEHLCQFADYIISYDREILVPQDDSVLQFTKHHQQIILRRSRGLAPNYYPNPFPKSEKNILALGAELKGSFAFINNGNLFVSQFLGNQTNIESQSSYQHTLTHLSKMLGFKVEEILTDKHPNYAISEFGEQLALAKNITNTSVQHHEAHFASVLMENELIETEEKILGVVWDGIGYGNDKQIWGGEFFVYDHYSIDRITHLNYFPHILGDKMSKEPRISALSLLSKIPHHIEEIKHHFNDIEWNFYKKQNFQTSTLMSSSMGRLLDGIACLLDISAINTYEGESALLLETFALKSDRRSKSYYELPYFENTIHLEKMLISIIEDKHNGIPINDIAYKVFYSLVKLISTISDEKAIDKIAFSGGVFQNSLLNEILVDELGAYKTLYFHKQLSANDEGISFGQLAFQHIKNKHKEYEYVLSNSR